MTQFEEAGPDHAIGQKPHHMTRVPISHGDTVMALFMVLGFIVLGTIFVLIGVMLTNDRRVADRGYPIERRAVARADAAGVHRLNDF